MVITKISPRYSFKGYNIFEALFRNKTEIKVLIAAIGGLTAYTGDWKTALIGIGVCAAGIVTKIAADAVDYFFTEVEITVSS